MPLAPQEIRTFFLTSVTWGRRAILQSDRMAVLLVDVFHDNQRKKRMAVHEFVVMPDHFHAILTPADEVSLEKSAQFIKGGFSFRAKRELGFNGEVWQESFGEH